MALRTPLTDAAVGAGGSPAGAGPARRSRADQAGSIREAGSAGASTRRRPARPRLRLVTPRSPEPATPAALVPVGPVETLTVVHQVPGRLRVRVPRLKEEPEFGDRAVAFLSRQAGVTGAHATPACASITVRYEPDMIDSAQIVTWLARAVPPASAAHHVRVAARPSIAALACGTAALGLSLVGAPAALTAGLLGVSAVPIFARALESLVVERHVSADALDASAVAALALRGDVFAAALSAALIAGGEYIRALTARRSRGALVGLLATTGQFAWVLRDGRTERVAAESLTVGDTVVVHPGELVPVDGVVLRGRGQMDQKVLTGESAPVLREPGQPVYAATLCTDGTLRVRAERVGAATRASRIVQILEGAPTHDTRVANYAARVADRLVLPTLGYAGAVYLATGNVTRAVSVIVFDFATGIRVSAPTTVLAAMTAAARRDVLVKGGRALEQLARVDTLVFDKTGTLTTGEPAVTDVLALGAESADEVLSLAAAAEKRLAHPAARAIVREAEARGLAVADPATARYAVGQGIAAEVAGAHVLVGSARYVVAQGVALPAAARTAAARAAVAGASTVYVTRDGALAGAITYADVARPEAAAVITALRSRGVRHMVMVTGDDARVAAVVARQLGIDEVEAEVFPERKAEIVQELQRAGRVVGVIGDGINDSPALAYADVSFSLKVGTDVARETADVVLHGDLNGLPDALDVARQSMRLIRQNLGIVAVPNTVGLVLAGLGLAGPVAATALNNGTNVVAGLNALRPLLRPPAPST